MAMATTWLDDPEIEEIDLDDEDEEEDFDDEEEEALLEAYDGDDPVEAYRRRRRYRRSPAMVRRQRLRRMRAQRRLGRRPPVRAARTRRRGTARTVRELDLDTRAQADLLQATLDAQALRFGAPIAATTAARQVEISFDDKVKDSRTLRTVLNGAPLLVLPGAPRGRGWGSFVSSPRIAGLGAVAAIALASELRERSKPGEVDRVVMTKELPEALAIGRPVRIIAEARDADGKRVSEKEAEIAWEVVSDEDSVDLEPATGPETRVEGKAAGTPEIRAKLGDKSTFTSTVVT
jgi:hypothetical protein